MAGWRLGRTTTPPPPPPPLAPVEPLWAWFDADMGVVEVAGEVLTQADQSGNGRNLTAVGSVGFVPNAINGLPGIGFGNFGVRLENATENMGSTTRTLMFVAEPFDLIGGTLMSFRQSIRDWAAYLFNLSGTQYVWSDGLANIARSGPPVVYSGAARLIEHVEVGGFLTEVRVDGVNILGAPAATTVENGVAGFMLGNREPGGYSQHWFGLIGAALIYDYALTAPQRAQNVAYLADRWGVVG